MKIGIITHYNVHNHGALLQLYALKKVLEDKGNNVSALQFNKNYDFMEAGIDKKYNISVRSVFLYAKYLFKNGIGRTWYNIKKKFTIDKFKNNMLGEFYSRAKDLDAVFIGSDEVFSFESGINPFFYGFGIPCNKIYSYAASFGPYTMEQIKEKRLGGFAEAGLKLMSKVSVRDNNSKQIIKTLSNIDSLEVCDPVILYGYKEEQNIKSIKLPFKNYILIYAYDNNMNDAEEVKRIKEYAKSRNLITVSVGFYHKWCDKNINATPFELLSYFKNSECVITDTFHGSVISLITNSQFASKLRNNQNKLEDLLSRFGTSSRIIRDFSQLEEVFSKEIDYSVVSKKIEESRKDSYSFIEDCLGDVINE